ncbi:MAG: 50S ribosomal protein L22 [Nitrospinota bacterium]|nr:50S ribosomal protein L22 [Nitrospinota bacterium]
MEVKARLKHTRSTPRKARLVADLIRGKNVNEAMNILSFTPKKSAGTIQKLLKSAIANAEENHKVLDVDDLYVKSIRVDKGVVWKRSMPRAR